MSGPVIAFVGGGQMAAALIAGLLRAGRSPRDLLVVEPGEAQRASLRERFGVKTLASGDETPASPDETLAHAQVVVWAVKPQVLAGAIPPVLASVPHALHISIAAGIDTGALRRWLRTDRVVRAMPNTPALIGAGVTGLLASPGVDDADRRVAADVFASTGMTFWVASDERLDAVTAVTGSGPGYLFQLLATFQAAAQAVGFSPAQARELVLRTCAGAVQQASADETPLATLRDRVASPGGTTEAGLAELARHGVDAALRDAVDAAYRRAGELSAGLAANAP